MSIQPRCQTTHPQIRLGDCPWCGAWLRSGAPSPKPSKSPIDARWWDTARMIADMDSEDETVRLATATNLVEHPPPPEEALRVLRKVMDDTLDRVSELATTAIARLSGKIDPEGVGPFEARLADDPSDLATLMLVLIVHLLGQYRSQDAREARQRHVLRVIESMPRVHLAGTALAKLYPKYDGEAFERGKRLWLEHVEANPRDARLIGNAAGFFAVTDDVRRGDLLRRCKAIEPENPEWSFWLGRVYQLAGNREPPESRKDWGAMSMAEFERARALASAGTTWELLVLPCLAKAAFDAADLVKARAYAEELLSPDSPRNEASRPGMSIHDGNLILGRVAFVEGDVPRAKAHLIAAVTAPGRDPFNGFRGFGPNTALAKDLLERGERECVIEFLKICAEHWELGRERVASWILEIELGRTPNFGANLIY